MLDAIIKVEHLSKQYRLYDNKADRLREAISLSKKQYHTPFYALDDISFEVNRGEAVGIIGTNGSGKSTLLKILTGVVTQTSGVAQVNGRISALLELGAGFNSEYTGLENINLHCTMMGFSQEETKLRKEEIIKFADIGDYIEQPVKNYSSGMFARLAFAVAISVEPDILIVDEALSVGDVFFQSKCFRKFRELCARGVTVLFVSHDTETVKEMCSRVLWIESGKQRMFGNSVDVCNAYFNEQMRRMNEENQKLLSGLEVKQDCIGSEVVSNVRFPKLTLNVNCVLSEQAEILSVYVKDERGLFTNRIVAGQRYTIGILTKFNVPMEHVLVGFTMCNSKGLAILASNNYSALGTALSVKKNDVVESRFSFDAPQLRKGQYEISPAVAIGIQENHVNLSWLHGVLKVSYERAGYEISEFGIPYDVENVMLDQYVLESEDE